MRDAARPKVPPSPPAAAARASDVLSGGCMGGGGGAALTADESDGGARAAAFNEHYSTCTGTGTGTFGMPTAPTQHRMRCEKSTHNVSVCCASRERGRRPRTPFLVCGDLSLASKAGGCGQHRRRYQRLRLL